VVGIETPAPKGHMLGLPIGVSGPEAEKGRVVWVGERKREGELCGMFIEVGPREARERVGAGARTRDFIAAIGTETGLGVVWVGGNRRGIEALGGAETGREKQMTTGIGTETGRWTGTGTGRGTGRGTRRGIGSGTVISTPTGIEMAQGTETGRETQMVQGAAGNEIERDIEATPAGECPSCCLLSDDSADSLTFRQGDGCRVCAGQVHIIESVMPLKKTKVEDAHGHADRG